MTDSGALNAPMNWGERIKVAREAAGLSQAALGKAIGKSQQVVGEYEREQSEPSLKVFQDIAKATGFQYSWLVLGVGSPKEGENGEDSRLDRDTVRQAIVAFERVMGREGLQYGPEEKAALIMAGYAIAMKEGGSVAVERVFERILRAAKGS